MIRITLFDSVLSDQATATGETIAEGCTLAEALNNAQNALLSIWKLPLEAVGEIMTRLHHLVKIPDSGAYIQVPLAGKPSNGTVAIEMV